MSNIMDYMLWRGDISLEHSPLNEVDNIILAMSTFADLSGIVPSDITAPALPFSEAMDRFEEVIDSRSYLGAIIPAAMLDIARTAARCPRFADIRLGGFTNDICEKVQMQFGAMTYFLPNGDIFIAFRGTDDTVVGWREDTKLGNMSAAPAQQRAVDYLAEAAAVTRGKIYLGGHSKGGNISMWAAAFSAPHIKERIERIYNYDGPGFYPEVINSPEYQSVADRIITYIPQSSIVGALFDQSPICKIIKSTQAGILQHDPLSWEVLGRQFVYLGKRSKFGIQSDETLKKWVYSMSEEEFDKLTALIFDIIDSTGAKTLTDLGSARIKNFNAILRSLRELDKDSRDMMTKLLIRLLGVGREPKTENNENIPKLPPNDDGAPKGE